MTSCCAGLANALKCLLIVAVGVLPVAAPGQTVRGVVTDRATGAVGAGAVVILERAAADSAAIGRSALTDASGAYAVLAFGPGAYRLSVRRIGRIPFLSEVLELSAGEVRIVDVSMDPIPVQGLRVAILSTVSVTRATPCEANSVDGARIATLWDDARTALMATEISSRDRLVSRRLLRYARDIDMPSMVVTSERMRAFDATDVPDQPKFRSLPGDSLSRVGYWRVKNGAELEFHGLDANALLSEAFVRDHCFALVEGTENRRGFVGLDFDPVPERTRKNAPPEVRGTIWMDAETSALRVVEFMWTKLRGDLQHVGGEVHFARVETGPWYVSSWRLRMPREVSVLGAYGTTRRPGILEEGGLVLDDTVDASRVPAMIEGEVRDAKHRALPEVIVRVLGTDLRAVTGSDGRYAITGVPPGLQFVVADHHSLYELGVRIGQKPVLLDDGKRREVSFTFPDAGEIASALCNGRAGAPHTAVLRLTLVDSATAEPLAGARIRLAARAAHRFATIEETDATGAVLFCGVPSDQVLVVTNAAKGSRTLVELSLNPGTVVGRVVKVRR